MLARVPAFLARPKPRDIMTNPFDPTPDVRRRRRRDPGGRRSSPWCPAPPPAPAPSIAGPAARRAARLLEVGDRDPRARPRRRRVRGRRRRRRFRPRQRAIRAANGVPAASGDPSAADLALIGEAWKAIEDNYVDAKNLNDRDLAYAAIRGLATAVGDEGHTRFLTADEAKATDQSLSGHVRRHRRPARQRREQGRHDPVGHPGHAGRGRRPQARRQDHRGGRPGRRPARRPTTSCRASAAPRARRSR